MPLQTRAHAHHCSGAHGRSGCSCGAACAVKVQCIGLACFWHLNPCATLSKQHPAGPTRALFGAKCAGDAVQATWVGHSTLLVQLEGLTLLTDPIFSERCRQAGLDGQRDADQCVACSEYADWPWSWAEGHVKMTRGAHHPDWSWEMNCRLPCLRCAHFARSPVQWMGPKRVVPPAFAIDDPRLPALDAVLLSHNHFGEGAAGCVLLL